MSDQPIASRTRNQIALLRECDDDDVQFVQNGEDNPVDEGFFINVKAEGWKQAMKIGLSVGDTMRKVYTTCALTLGKEITDIFLKFDGDVVPMDDTCEDLRLICGEMLHVHEK